MAGRGTDIKLGKGVVELGGLYVIGTEKHESRRVDEQLRGRSGRQGDIGESKFFVSLEDEIILRSGMTKLQKWMKSLDEAPIESRVVSKSLTIAQKRIEGNNYDHRKSVIEYDDVINNHRLIVYSQRDKILTSKNYRNLLFEMLERTIKYWSTMEQVFDKGNFIPNQFINLIRENFGLTEEDLPYREELNQDHTIKYVQHHIIDYTKAKFNRLEDEKQFRTNDFIRDVMLTFLDKEWTDYLHRISKLRSGIRYRQYAQKNPIQVYVFESRDMFENFKNKFIETVVKLIICVNPEANKIINDAQKDREIKDLLVN